MSDMELIITVLDEENIQARSSLDNEVIDRYNLTPWERDLIQVFQHFLGRDDIKDRKELEVLGELLYRTVFPAQVRGLFEQLRKDSIQQNGRFRVSLSFQNKASDLANYPWEFLYVPDTNTSRGYFMATEPDLVLSRYLPLRSDRLNLSPGESPLRLLVAVSEPEDPQLKPVLAGPVVDSIQKLAKDFPIEVTILEQPTLEKIENALVSSRPHVLHFIGHGRFDQAARIGEIALVNDDQRSVQWIPDQMFADTFRQMQVIPRLVILHNCEGGTNDFTAKFAGLAPQLIRADVQAVIAMQYPITNRAAIDFSREFYQALAKGRAVDSAVQNGRWRVMTRNSPNYNSRVFGTPVLYMRARNALIWPITTN